MNQIIDIELEKIEPDPDQPRKYFDEAKLQELAVSIGELGVRTPITVRPHPKKPGRHIIEVGERRWRASQIAGKETIPAIVDTAKFEPGLVLEHQMIENSQRADVSPLEEGETYLRLKKHYGHTVETLMARTGKSRSHVYSRMKLTELHPTAKAALTEGKLLPAIADLIATIADPAWQEQATKECLGLATPNDYRDGHVTPEYADGSTPTPLSFRAAKILITTKYKLRLALAPFDKDDPNLTQDGACGPCTFRSGNQPQLPGVGPASPVDDLCTRPKAPGSKATWKGLLGNAIHKLQHAYVQDVTGSEKEKAQGHAVLDFKAAEKEHVFGYDGTALAKSSPWVDPKSELPPELAKCFEMKTKAAWVRKAGRLLVNKAQAVEVLREANKLAPDMAPKKVSANPAYEKKETKAEDLELRNRALDRMARAAMAAVAGDLGKREAAWMRWLATWIIDIYPLSLRPDGLLMSGAGINVHKPWGPQLLDRANTPAKVRQLLTGLLFEDLISCSTNEPKSGGLIDLAGKALGVDDYKTFAKQQKTLDHLDAKLSPSKINPKKGKARTASPASSTLATMARRDPRDGRQGLRRDRRHSNGVRTWKDKTKKKGGGK